MKGLFDGQHVFRLEDHGNGTTTFIQEEIFSGLLVRFINLQQTEKGFHLMNQALKNKAEEI